MENMNGKVERMARRNARRRLWQRFVAIPAAIVVFVTTYALILPAIALERDTYCGQEAHTHTDECYTAQLACGYEDGAVMQSTQTVTALACTVSAHHHTEECFDENGSVICGIADYFVHTHTTDCFNALGELVCPLPEVEAHTHTDDCYAAELVNVCGLAEEEGHTHTDACYTVVSHPEMVCGLSESAGHWHDENCYTPVESTCLVCGLAESAGHVHGEGCWITTVLEDGTEVTELACGLPESAGHTHTDACYVTETTLELTCGLAEGEGHTHTDACYINVEDVELTCGLPESAGHTHTDACYVTEMRLVCGKPEVILHSHNEDCYTTTVLEDGTEVTELTCTQTVVEEHVHSAECFTTYEEVVERTHEHTDLCYIQVLTCTLPEHEHTDACYDKPEEELPEATDEPETAGEPADGGDADPETAAEPETTAKPADGGDADPETAAEPEAAGEPVDGGDADPETTAEPEAAGEPADGGDADPETTAEPEAAGEPADGETAEPEYICGMEEHTHSDSCYTVTVAEDGTETSELICEKPEHTHGESCLPAVIVEEEPQPEVEIVEEDTPHFQLPVLICGLAEHEHSTNCMDENMVYACGVTPHTHTGACYAIPDMEGVSPILVCQKHEHFHTEACYDETGALICPIEAHTHDVACFALPEGVEDPDEAQPVYYCGMEEHTHADSCYDESGELICEKTEHTHDDSCRVAPTYYCGFEAHTHSEACLDANGEPVCGLPEHEHTDECLVEPTWYCGYEEHTHDETCFNENGELVCALEEHTHSAVCLVEPTWYCGKTAHTHGESCYDENGELICGMEEHIHTADCRVEHFTQIAMAEGVMVTAKYTSEAGFPADAVLQVVRFADGEHYEARVNEAENVFYAANPDQIFQPRALLNIGFYLPDGTEVEPIAPVDVTVQMLDENGLAEGEQYTVIHYGAAGTELLDAEHTDSSVNFSADSFSDFIIGDDEGPSDGGSTVADNGQNEADDETNSEADGEEETVPPINWGSTLPNWLVGTYFQSSANSDNGSYAYSVISGTLDKNFAHNKTIDWLGDGQDNPDTDAGEKEVNDDLYRLYLDMEGKAEPTNLLFIIDRSSSMRTAMPTGVGNNNERRDATLANLLMGTNNQKGLIEQFLERNNDKTADQQSYVAAVWFGGKYDGYGDFNKYLDKNGNAVSKSNLRDDTYAYMIGVKNQTYTDDAGTVFNWTSKYTGTLMTNGHERKDGQIGALPSKDSGTEGTNYCAGLLAADKMIDTLPDVAKKNQTIVIFISDGLPTYFYQSKDYGKTTVDRYGEALEDKAMACREGLREKGGNVVASQYGFFTQTNAYYDAFKSNNPGIRFFTVGVGVGGCTSTFRQKGYVTATEQQEIEKNGGAWTRSYDVMNHMGEGGMKQGNDAAALEQVLKQIVFPSNVTITDELSEYVELFADDPDVKVTATKKKDTSNVTILWEGGSNGNGTYGTAKNGNKLEGTGPVVSSVTYSNNRVTVKFDTNYSLSGDYFYTLSFNVRLTQKAYDTYAQNLNRNSDRYGGVKGAAGTDYGSNTTSSGQAGFHSNADFNDAAGRGAYVEYSVDGQTGKLDYPHPVVQCWGTEFLFQKTSTDAPDVGLKDIPFKLTKDGSAYTPTWVKDKTGNPLTAEDGWYRTDEKGYINFGYLPCGTYELWEKVPNDYSTDVGMERNAETREVKWMTFTVEKGRIINVKQADGVTWVGDDASESGTYNFNSEPNKTYFSGEAKLTVQNKSYDQPLQIVKRDEKGEALAGAWFQLSRNTSADPNDPVWKALSKEELVNFIKDEFKEDLIELGEDGNAYLVSNESGLVFTGRLPYGHYRLVEHKAPLNYERLEEEKAVRFSVDQYGIKLEPGDDTYKEFAELDDTGDPLTLTIKDERLTADWKLKKVDSDRKLPLEGATFEMYGPYDNSVDNFEPDTEKRLYTGTTDGEGLFPETEEHKLPDLLAGKFYYLVETEAPAGYNKLDGAIQLHFEETPMVDGSKGAMKLTVTYGGTPREVEPDTGEGGTAVYTVEITNNTGYELPESGGIGTTIFYMSGLALMALAGALLCGRKRRSCG